MTRFMCRCCVVVPLILAACGYRAAHRIPNAWVTTIEAPQYFAVWVEDVDTSVEWYRTVFGLRNLGGSQADDGSWRIENVGNDLLLVEIVHDERAQDVPFARGFGKVGFGVSDIEDIADREALSTGERPRILDFPSFGVRILQLTDPDGNIIQLSSKLPR